MTVVEIRALQPPADDDAHLYLWTTNRYLRDAYGVVEAWGFSSPTVLVWCKPHDQGLFGGAFLSNVEFVLFARRGTLAHRAKIGSRWFTWPRAEHSAKPEAFLDLVEQVSPGPYLELFARRNRFGWDTWGNECLEHVDLGGAA
jgi:N6-adenosine-specific RNA methylase IME4